MLHWPIRDTWRPTNEEEVMAKGQMKGNKEAKKPKADKNQPKATASAYKLAQGKDGQSLSPFAKKS